MKTIRSMPIAPADQLARRINRGLNRRGFLQTAAVAGGIVLGNRRGWTQAAESPLIVRTETPLNAEPPLERLVQSWLTPTEHFYVRSHAPNPSIDVENFTLSVEGMVERPLKLTLADLQQRFDKKAATVTMTCAGNRREEFNRIKPVGGVQWDAGAIGNATWGGAALADVLAAAGVKEGAAHVWFEGVDEIERPEGVIGFGGSIPIEKALSNEANAPALVAYEMNGAPLTPDHGFPMRTVVPGYIGARSVKWLGKIVVSDRPSDNHYIAGAYKVVQQEDEFASAEPIYEYPINAVICTPAGGATIEAGKVDVRGYALASGDPRALVRGVELSVNGGKTWIRAALEGESQPFCWRLWRAEVEVDESTRAILVRGADTTGRMQPRQAQWNLKGYLYNAWHRAPVVVKS